MIVFETSFPVRYYETDQMGVVHHSNYIRYFELARNEMMSRLGLPIQKCESELNVVVSVVSVECRFRHPAKMGDVLTASACIDKVPLAKLTVGQSVRNQDGELCAEGSVCLGFLDRNTLSPLRCPEPVSRIIEQNITNC